MSLRDEFNYKDFGSNIQKTSRVAVRWYSSDYCDYHYNFVTRVLVVTDGSGKSVSAIPFSQLDRESLDVMREALISLGGTPPALPEEPEKFSVRLTKDTPYKPPLKPN